jgi:RNA polymerase sigma-54 factor
MTPQLLQAIKLLQLSSIELAAYVDTEIERNPMLERAEAEGDPAAAPEPSSAEAAAAEPREGDWADAAMATDGATAAGEFGTEAALAFPEERPAPGEAMPDDPGRSLHWEGASGGGFDGEDAPDIEAYLAAPASLADHLEAQLRVAPLAALDRAIARAIIASIDEAGYLGETVEAIARRLDVPAREVERMLAVVQSLEPSGVGARSLAECLAIQLRERDRFDPAMAALIANLDLLAKRDYAKLKRICGVDDDDLAGMIGEVRRLDPKPGAGFGARALEAAQPDVFVLPTANGGWRVELNALTLPRVLVNRSYYAEVSALKTDKASRGFIEEAWSNANWLSRSLEQRARTILKVAGEIVRQQDAFFVHGVTRLKPMNLKNVAEQVGLHESTISRVTANKLMASPRGMFEMKYFFTAALPSAHGEGAHSAEAVRHRIRQMIEAEPPDAVLSDDAIVDRLKRQGVEVARRTVAKYREAMRIPSSAARRREKKALSTLRQA